MRIKLKNHTEVVKAWIEQSQPYGYCGNISFEGKVIFSYDWWPMARIVDDIVLYRDMYYSKATSKHQSLVRLACLRTGRRIMCVGDVSDSPIEQVFENNMAYFEREISSAIEHEDRATTRKHYWHTTVARFIADMAEYIKRFCPYPDKGNHGWVVYEKDIKCFSDALGYATTGLESACVFKTRSEARAMVTTSMQRVKKVRLNSKGRPVAVIGRG